MVMRGGSRSSDWCTIIPTTTTATTTTATTTATVTATATATADAIFGGPAWSSLSALSALLVYIHVFIYF